jgi:hypothetical protein
MLTQTILREKLFYDDGKLYRRGTSGKIATKHIGSNANTKKRGTVSINGKSHTIYRVIFIYHHGYIPNHVDHIDGDFNNNRIENLRDCTNSENQRNKPAQPNTTSQYKGVCWNKLSNKWTSTANFEGSRKHLGRFKTELEAASAYDKYMKQFNSPFVYLNLE